MTDFAKNPSSNKSTVPAPEASGQIESVRAAYDKKYASSNFFLYRKWLYRSYVKALAKRVGIMRGAKVLDAGCGQGFFTALLADLGFNATGVDLSSVGINAAREEFGGEDIQFLVGDVLDMPFREQFDAVFVRSCSLYNVEDLTASRDVTARLLNYVRPGGSLVFDYYSRLNKSYESQGWRYHDLSDLKSHFHYFGGTKCFFSLRVDSIALGTLSFSGLMTRINQMISRCSGVGGELVAIVPKPK